jgi:hypothetical protein
MHNPGTTAQERHEFDLFNWRVRKGICDSLLADAIDARNRAADILKPDSDPAWPPEKCQRRARGWRQIMRRCALRWRAKIKALGIKPRPPQGELTF